MLWKRRAATGKQDHRAVVRRVLRPGAGLRCKQEVATAARAWRPAVARDRCTNLCNNGNSSPLFIMKFVQ
jgi:hypothetical protein